MLTITVSTSAAQAVTYHTKDQARENYYSNGQELPGRWGGRGAERLGLAGESRTADFESLCYNVNPHTGEQLTARMKENRRVGYDFTFSSPKSVSLLYEWSGDERILEKFDQAIERTMEIVQEHAATRVRKGRRDENRLTKELVWCQFDHFTARPEDGIPDPQMHRHCYVFNATFDPVEGVWKAAQFGDIKADGEYFQSIWLSELSKGLTELGYEVAPAGKFFEVGGISRSLIEKFSRRTQTIQAKAEELGITDPAQVAQLAALTREKKARHLTREELHRDWWGRLSPEDIRELNEARGSAERRAALGLGKGAEHEAKTAEAEVEPSREDMRAVRFAVEHLFERRSVVYEQELIAEALQWGYGKSTLVGIGAAVKDWTLIRGTKHGHNVLTTRRVLEEEKRIVEWCRSGRQSVPALNSNWEILDERLNAQQRAAVQHILRSEDVVIGVVGKSGAGKTTALKQAANGVRAVGKYVMAFAPTASASRRSLREAGFPEAETVARLLASENLQREARGAVWFVDEAGLMSARVTDRLFALAERLAARVVIVGDPGQHHSVERGDAFRLLRDMGVVSVATLDEIQRQKGDYKRAVEQIAANEFMGAFETMQRMGALREMPYHERQEALASRYLELAAQGKSVVVTSPTHAEGARVTEAIREKLREQGTLRGGRDYPILRNLSWTEARRRDWHSYERGLVVQVNQTHDGLVMGDRLEVVAVADHRVEARDCRSGVTKVLPLEDPETFGVYRKDSLRVATGDRIRITECGRTAGNEPVNTGDVYGVEHMATNGEIHLDNGWRLGRHFAHVEFGYTETSHAVQGKTCDWVLVAQSAVCSAAASNANQFYVSISRGREGVEVFTENIEILRENVARVHERMHALELVESLASEEGDRASAELGARTEVGELALEVPERCGAEKSTETVDAQRLPEDRQSREEEYQESLSVGEVNWVTSSPPTRVLEPEPIKEPERTLELEID